MDFHFVHINFNVLDLDASLAFYKKALGMAEARRKVASDGSFILVYLSDEQRRCELELTWLRDRKEPYNLGEKEFHIAFSVRDFESAYRLHKDMGVICYENPSMGIYFIEDPDGYWLEVVPEK